MSQNQRTDQYFGEEEMTIEAKVINELHECESTEELKVGGYGMAIDACWAVPENKDDMNNKNMTLWVGNGEYENQVRYCPFCGVKASDLSWED